MTTRKQIEANKKNALMSEGAVTEGGKAIVAQNAVKHGIFTKDLIIDKGDGKENIKDYEELLLNLTNYFDPKGQLETSLVEKIAVDFWRLRRVVRFETGSIRCYLDHAIDDYYDQKSYMGRQEHKSPKIFHDEIEKIQEELEWDAKFLKYLKADKVDITQDIWETKDIEADIKVDYIWLIEHLENEEKEFTPDNIDYDNLTTTQIRQWLQKSGYTDKKIKGYFIEHYQTEISRLDEEIAQIQAEKAKCEVREEVQKRLKVLPSEASAKKILRYERSIEKSIFQKIIMLNGLKKGRT